MYYLHWVQLKHMIPVVEVTDEKIQPRVSNADKLFSLKPNVRKEVESWL